jgi:hypothetical protein
VSPCRKADVAYAAAFPLNGANSDPAGDATMPVGCLSGCIVGSG